MIDLTHIRKIIKNNNFIDAIEELRIFSDFRNDIEIFERRYNDITSRERKGSYKSSKAANELNKLYANLVDLISTIEKTFDPKDPKKQDGETNKHLTNIEEEHLKILETHLDMDDYKTDETEIDSYLKSYFFLVNIQNDVLLLKEKISLGNLNTSKQINSMIGELTVLQKKIKEWGKTLEASKNGNSSLQTLLEELDEGCEVVKTERIEVLSSTNRANRIFTSKVASMVSMLESVNVELEQWIGQAAKYRQN